jgi:hypothetical protein
VDVCFDLSGKRILDLVPVILHGVHFCNATERGYGKVKSVTCSLLSGRPHTARDHGHCPWIEAGAGEKAEMDHERYRRMHGRSGASMKKASFEVALKGKQQIAQDSWAFVFERPDGFRFKAASMCA